MFNDVIDGTIDFEKEWNEAKELLKEAKEVILDERHKRFVIEKLYNETINDARVLADFINKNKDKFDEKELKQVLDDKWDTEEDNS